MLAVGSRTCMLRLRLALQRGVPAVGAASFWAAALVHCDSMCRKQQFLKVCSQQVLGTVCISFDSFVQKWNPGVSLGGSS